MNGNISIVIGSWGSYNECNERALGSKWLDLTNAILQIAKIIPPIRRRKMTNEIKLVIGSWGSYNACNDRALGSEWLCLNTYSDWNQIAAALKKQGFRLDGIDIELFENSDRHLDDELIDYFDFEEYGRSTGLSCAEEYSGGIIEIL